MRITVVLHYLGRVLASAGLFMFFPMLWSVYYREPDVIAFLLSTALTTLSGMLLAAATFRGAKKLTTREALALVAVSLVMVAAFGTLPYLISNVFDNFLYAYFETIAGFTSTNATLLASLESQTHGILMWRAMTQWLGGMGIIAVFVVVFPMLNIGPAQLVEADVRGVPVERLTARIRDTFRALWRIYAVLSLAEVLLLMLAGLSPFEAVATTFSTVASGGFAVRALNVGGFDSLAVEIIIIFFMLTAAVNFGIFYSLFWKRSASRLLHDIEFRVFIGILLAACIVISLDLFVQGGQSVGNALRYGFFQAISFQTTTGFFTTDYTAWPALSQGVLMILMVIGGSSGSTAGALKVFRIVVLTKFAYRELIHIFSPRTVLQVKFGERTLPEWVLSRIVGTGILYAITFVISFLMLSAVGLDMVSAASSVASTMGTVGPALGVVGPGGTYMAVPLVGKIVLMIDMVVGRLEFWTVLALLSPAFWKWR